MQGREREKNRVHVIFWHVNPGEQRTVWSTLTPSARGRKIQWPRSHRTEYCHCRRVTLVLLATICAQSNRSLCPYNTALGLQGEFRVWWLAALPLLLLRQPVQILSDPCGLCTLLLHAPEVPSVCIGRAVFCVAWALLMRQMSSKGTGDEFPSLVHAQALQPGSPSLLSCLLSTGRVNWLISSEIWT